MNNKIFLIIQHDFDASENHNPEYDTTIGYAETEELAKEIAEDLQTKSKKYKGWHDDTAYPYFTVKELKHIKEFLKK